VLASAGGESGGLYNTDSANGKVVRGDRGSRFGASAGFSETVSGEGKEETLHAAVLRQ
jgi:hypothetical protein